MKKLIPPESTGNLPNEKLEYVRRHKNFKPQPAADIKCKRTRQSYGIKVKVKLSLCLIKYHAMKTNWGSGGIAPRILDLGTRWR
jgi:hypothetical protein